MSARYKPTIFAGIDGGSPSHQACVLASDGTVLGEKAFPHSGKGRGARLDGMRDCAGCGPEHVAAALETPHGPVVDRLLDRGFQVFSIHPKQRDRFRDQAPRMTAGTRAYEQAPSVPIWTAYARAVC